MDINIDDIKITNRIRKDNGEISSLAANISEIGLLHPIVINEANELICGHRRILAFKKLQRKQIPCTTASLASLANGEFSENAYRKDFTISEMVKIKRTLEPEIKREAGIRMKAGKPSFKLGKGRSTEIIAKALRIGHTSLEKAEKLVDAAEKQPEKFKQLLEKVDNGKISLEGAYKQILQQEIYDKKQIGEQLTSQARTSTTFDESKRIFANITNEKQETTNQLPTTKEQAAKDHELHSQSSELQTEMEILRQDFAYLVERLGEKSPDFSELYEERNQLRAICRERGIHRDFTSAASLPATSELQQKVDKLQNELNEQKSIIAKNTFQADLQLKEQIIPLIIIIDRISGKVQVMIDAAKMKRSLS
jgi:ParB family transcriptional regulator, chromosome partitioning protein